MRKLLFAVVLCALPSAAFAQSSVQPYVVTGTNANGGNTSVPVGDGSGTSKPMPVTVASGSGTQDVNLKQVGGSTISTSNPVPTKGSFGQGSTTSGQTGNLSMMATTATPPTDTDAQTNPIRGDTHGGMRSTCQDTNGTVCDFTSPTLVILTSQYPNGATPITGNATGTTGAVVGTLAGTGGKTTYICGFDVSALGGTATVGPITVAGLTGSSAVYQFSSLAAGNTLSIRYTGACIPASATNTSITITTTADGTATAVDVNSFGYQL